MTWTWDRVEAESTPPETTVTICVRGDLAAEHERLEAELDRAQRDDLRENRAPLAPAIAQRIVDLEAQMSEYDVEFRFRGVTRKTFTDLVASHPATEEQQQDAGDFALPWNPQTFPPALVAASCVAPEGITLERAQHAFDSWSFGQWAKLWRSCLNASQGSADPGPKSTRASAILRGSELN